ncbi:MAG: hypothetical protein HYT35_00945, partial [Candidatus Staskawiczbacteria bacterium]|nr:hypothetical protein [Candidatus Staskawiczbacteria bacterium]
KAGLNVDPLFAEDLLATKGKQGISEVYNYYNSPKGGKQYDFEWMRRLLTEGRSLAIMLG